ncbi:MAG: hypothetical protein AAF585_23560 [Verrucomicrobiota bacterium]
MKALHASIIALSAAALVTTAFGDPYNKSPRRTGDFDVVLFDGFTFEEMEQELEKNESNPMGVSLSPVYDGIFPAKIFRHQNTWEQKDPEEEYFLASPVLSFPKMSPGPFGVLAFIEKFPSKEQLAARPGEDWDELFRVVKRGPKPVVELIGYAKR